LRNVGDRMRNGDFLDVMLKYPIDGEGEDYEPTSLVVIMAIIMK
jgi:hypothetical protein